MIPILPEWTADQQQFLSKHTLVFHFSTLNFILYCALFSHNYPSINAQRISK